jgi:hypothetical protein
MWGDLHQVASSDSRSEATPSDDGLLPQPLGFRRRQKRPIGGEEMIHPLSLAALQVSRFAFWARWSTGARFVVSSVIWHGLLVSAVLWRGAL